MKNHRISLGRSAVRVLLHRRTGPLIVMTAIGVIGIISVFTGRAMSPTSSLEAEGGTANGVNVTTDTTASGGKAIKFGTGVPAPSNLRAFTGGNNIAIMWDKSLSTNLKQYDLYRNGVKIATTMPSGSSSYHTFDGTRYYDADVTAGTTYSYQVSQTLTSGTNSPLSAPISVVQPSSTSAVPDVTIDTTAAPDLASYAAQGKAAIQTWYPKEADLLTTPEYTPPTSINIVFANNSSGAPAFTTGSTITVDIAYARAHPDDLGIFVHESTHVLQAYAGYVPAVLTEGMPAWVTNNMFHDNDARPPAKDITYNKGYDDAAYFLQWIMATYHLPAFLHNLNAAGHNGAYNDSLFKSYTGKSIGQLWSQMTGQTVSSPGPLIGIASKCADVTNANTAWGTPIQLLTCRSTNPAQTYISVAGTTTSDAVMLQVYNECLDVTSSGTADGTKIQLWGCNDTNAQLWLPQADGTLKNVNSGKCLQPSGASSADFTQLVISTCNSSAAQKWTMPPA